MKTRCEVLASQWNLNQKLFFNSAPALFGQLTIISCIINKTLIAFYMHSLILNLLFFLNDRGSHVLIAWSQQTVKFKTFQFFSVYGCVTFRYNWNFHSTSPFHCLRKFSRVCCNYQKQETAECEHLSNIQPRYLRFRVRHRYFLGHNFYCEQCSAFIFSICRERFGFNLFSCFTSSGALFCHSETICAFETSEHISDMESHSRNMDSGEHFERWRVRCWFSKTTVLLSK